MTRNLCGIICVVVKIFKWFAAQGRDEEYVGGGGEGLRVRRERCGGSF